MVDPPPLTGEPLAIDLVNTRPHTADGPVDLLGDVTRLRAWLDLQAERLPEPTPDLAALAAADVAAVHAVREHIAAAVQAARHGERPPATALNGLNAALRAAPAAQELVWSDGSVQLTAHRSGTPGTRLAALFAEDAARLLTDPAVRTVRPCEADDCVMLFLPTHPRRRWCSASRCGNRARVARYYQRHKAT
ncbi:ABATE domain-containing protein [Streptomyces sp. NBC_00237]|uniref:CGNR zinc finger domain-containing protein n=1 Tax=Streptomyces sp. NBC_00237 TaxID=2975687 RepID=UPI002252492E|nr:ABATE domain-containing protein [Streptomyces sp. NBC_00237]MCX5206327.1 ABATE domain-containing protein [Streptomyces sp. NBC_00237]